MLVMSSEVKFKDVHLESGWWIMSVFYKLLTEVYFTDV
jgi:hypothetical protein